MEGDFDLQVLTKSLLSSDYRTLLEVQRRRRPEHAQLLQVVPVALERPRVVERVL